MEQESRGLVGGYDEFVRVMEDVNAHINIIRSRELIDDLSLDEDDEEKCYLDRIGVVKG